MGTIGTIIGTIIFGAIIGMLARLVLPGKQHISLVITIILGIIGALIGYWVWGKDDGGGIDWLRWITSIAAAALLVVIYGMIVGRKQVGQGR